MNCPSRLWPYGELQGCDGDGCASPIDTWPLHHAYRPGVRRRLCTSCILLSHRKVYCCCCFFLIPGAAPWSRYVDGDPHFARPSPTATCQACHNAVAHLACLGATDGVFTCPACKAAEEGRPFTYAPPCRVELKESDARVLISGARMALDLLKWNAAEARAEAERLVQNAAAARTRAYRALSAALDVDTEKPSWNVHVQPVEPAPRPAGRLDQGEGSEASVDAPGPLVQQQRYAMPPLAALTIGAGDVTQLAMAATAAARNSLTPPRELPLFSFKGKAPAVAEASPPTRPTLQLFPTKASTSKTTPRTLQLFQDEIPDDEDM